MPDSQRSRDFNPTVHNSNPTIMADESLSQLRSSGHAVNTNQPQHIDGVQYHNAQLAQQITQSIIFSLRPSIHALYQNQKIISQTVHALRNEGRQQTKEITGVVEASQLMTRKELKRVFERVGIGAGISTVRNREKTLVERLDGIECAILELAERVCHAEVPLPQPTRHEIAVCTETLKHADACVTQTSRLPVEERITVNALVNAVESDVRDSTPSGSGLESQAISPKPSRSKPSSSVSVGSGLGVIRIPAGRSVPDSVWNRNQSVPAQLAEESQSQKEPDSEQRQVPSYPQSYNDFWTDLNTFKSRIHSAADPVSASGLSTTATCKRKRSEDDDEEEEEGDEGRTECQAPVLPTSSGSLALAKPADFQTKGIHPSSLASSTPAPSLSANSNLAPIFTPSERIKTPAREIEDGSVANLRKEVLGSHLFVRPLEDFGLESWKEDGGGGGDDEQNEEDVQGSGTQVLVGGDGGVDLEHDKQAGAEGPTGDQPMEENKSGEGDDVEDVEPQVVNIPFGGGGITGVNNQETAVGSHPRQLPNLTPMSELDGLDAEEDTKTEGREYSRSESTLTDLDPDIDVDLYNTCLEEGIHTPGTTPSPPVNPELVVKEELGDPVSFKRESLSPLTSLSGDESEELGDPISFKRESLSPLTSLSGDESEEEIAYLDGNGNKRKLGRGVEVRRESKRIKAHSGGATRQRRTSRSLGILLQGEERCSKCTGLDRPCSARPGRHCKNCRKRKWQCSRAKLCTTVSTEPMASTSAIRCDWPTKSEGDASFLVQLIACDTCHAWYHYGCVGIVPGDLRCEDGEEFTCPPCSYFPHPQENEKNGTNCTRPDCTFAKENSDVYFVNRIVGRKPTTRDGTFANADFLWLVTWQGYPISAATWIPEENMSDSRRLVSKFNENALQEGFGLDTEDIILLNEAYEGGWRE